MARSRESSPPNGSGQAGDDFRAALKPVMVALRDWGLEWEKGTRVIART